MLSFVGRRFIYMFPLLIVVTFIIFALMKLQPGDAIDVICGLGCGTELREKLRVQYGLEKPDCPPIETNLLGYHGCQVMHFATQYLKWGYGVIGRPGLNYDASGNVVAPFITISPPDFGYSARNNMSALRALAGEGRIEYTLMLIIVSMFLSWMIAIPIGIYSATHKYSKTDHAVTFLGFLGLSIPNFILALLFMAFVVAVLRLGQVDQFFAVGGFLNSSYVGEEWTLMKFLNFLWHFLPPVFILAAANTSAIIRYMRGSLLDVLSMGYVQTARAKGLKEKVVIYKHAVRNAINPLISMLGFWIPYMMEGALVIAIVFNLPQIEKSFFDGITNRDLGVVTTGLIFFSLLLMIGNLVSDILLALSDPKIRYD